MNIIIKRALLVLLVFFSLPIFLHVYQPIAIVGAIGIFLGIIGFLFSPIILFAVLLVFVVKSWKKQI